METFNETVIKTTWKVIDDLLSEKITLEKASVIFKGISHVNSSLLYELRKASILSKSNCKKEFRDTEDNVAKYLFTKNK